MIEQQLFNFVLHLILTSMRRKIFFEEFTWNGVSTAMTSKKQFFIIPSATIALFGSTTAYRKSYKRR
jgi:hypothetical protein